MQLVEIKVHGSVATILMDRPDQRNALNPQLLEELKTAFSDVHQERRVGAVVLSGAGEHFCSGIDLKVLAAIAEMSRESAFAQWHAVWRDLTDLFEQMLRFPKPIVAAIDGAAIGAGFGLALASDLIVTSTRASLSAAAIRRGLVGGATAALLSFRFGGAIAARMLLAEESIDAGEAYRLGMTFEPVSPHQIWVAGSQVAARCGEAPREAIQATKRLLNEHIGETLMTQLAAGSADSATACTTESALEGIKSFLERRDPQWP